MTSASATADQAAAEEKAAVLAGTACYFFWGFLPLLFRASAQAGATAWEIVAWRSFWSVVIAGAAVLFLRGWPRIAEVLRSPRTLAWLFASAGFIGVNWLLFVWAVDHGHTLDASLGYYLNPLMSVAAGMLLFRERIGAGGWIAIVLAAAGVTVQTIAHGHLPLAALGMATSFCIYGVIRKRVNADALTGLFIECVILGVPGLAYGLWVQSTGAGHAAQPLAGVLLFLGGPATVAPLVTFSWAARRMPLSTLGFLQFIAPTMQFVIGVTTGEALSPLSIVAFALIWSGVAVYAFTAWRKAQGARVTRERGPE